MVSKIKTIRHRTYVTHDDRQPERIFVGCACKRVRGRGRGCGRDNRLVGVRVGIGPVVGMASVMVSTGSYAWE